VQAGPRVTRDAQLRKDLGIEAGVAAAALQAVYFGSVSFRVVLRLERRN
jgi:hypothetical protein